MNMVLPKFVGKRSIPVIRSE